MENPVETKKLRVAAYARVSTDREEQEDSFERQVDYYTSVIHNRSEWSFVGIYADPGISGTKAEKRPDFMRMINDCRGGKIDKILVKSLSRFARNTVDALTYIRELRDLNISITFESENIDTLTPGGEVLLTILAAIAEQESRTISKNIKWAYQKKCENGEVMLNTGLMLGYTKTGVDENKMTVYEINDEEAEIVRRIYREYLAGLTPRRIANNLMKDGIKTKLGKGKWHYSVVHSILTNEKYTGNAILGKTFKPDITSPKRYKNEGQVPQYYVENTHPAIIDLDTFERVQHEMEYRRNGDEECVGEQKYSSKYPFSGILICGQCGSKYRRHRRRMGNGTMVTSWACANKVTNGIAACHSKHIREEVLIKTYVAAVKKLAGDYDNVIATLKKSAEMIYAENVPDMLKEVSEKIDRIQDEVMKLHRKKQDGSISVSEYNKMMKQYKKELKESEKKKADMQQSLIKTAHIKDWIKEFNEQLERSEIENVYDGLMIKKLVRNIKVYDDRMVVNFSYGITIEQEYAK